MGIKIDHLLLTVPTLMEGISYIEDLCGARAVLGGRHPTIGTENALLSLGDHRYLEIIAPYHDPEATVPNRPFGLDHVEKPTLKTWAARSFDLESLLHRAQIQQIDLGSVIKGNRQKPDGSTLSWMFSDIYKPREEGVIPFLIQWGDIHPTDALESVLTLQALDIFHPEPQKIQEVFDFLAINITVQYGPKPALKAYLDTPNGVVELA